MALERQDVRTGGDDATLAVAPPEPTTRAPAAEAATAVPTGVSIESGDGRGMRRGRRVQRIVRRVQLWSVFKVALLGSIVFYVVCLVAVAVLWSIATSTGQVHHIEKFMRDIGFDNWRFNGGRLFQATALAGAVLTVATSVLLTLAAAIVNLISELTGGIRFTVIEVEPGQRVPTDRSRRAVGGRRGGR